MKIWLLRLGIVLPLLSMFLWAGFDIQWWVKLEHGASAREFMLIMMHVVMPAICGVFYLIALDEGRQQNAR